MYLSKIVANYYKVIKSERRGKRRLTLNIRYVGKLSFIEREKLKILLKAATPKDLTTIINKARNPSLQIVSSPNKESKVSLIQVRENVYRKSIDLEWLRQAYVEEKKTLGAIAGILGVDKERVREHLDLLRINKNKRIELSHERHVDHHPEFGWQIIAGERVRDPDEFKIIEQIAAWKNEGVSYNKIAIELTKMKVAGRLGSTTWDRSTVRKLLIRNLKRL